MKAQEDLVFKGSYVNRQFWYKRATGFSLHSPPPNHHSQETSLAFQSEFFQNYEGGPCYGKYIIKV